MASTTTDLRLKLSRSSKPPSKTQARTWQQTKLSCSGAVMQSCSQFTQQEALWNKLCIGFGNS